MKLSDYVIQYLADHDVRHVFLVTGGGVVNLVDSFRKVEGINYVCVKHEQAAAIAAEGYARVSKNIGVAMATSGPGATNLLTGIACAYFDSIPTLFITGQVNTREARGEHLVRQIGFQETDIVAMAKPITKFAAQINKPEEIKHYLDKAVQIAKSGRPGPVLLDIPIDVQMAEFDPDQKINQILELIKQAKRPIILIGAGIKLAQAQKEAKELVEKLNIPVVTSWGAADVFPASYPLLVGQIGVSAHRGANFAVQNCDLLLSIGSRLDTRQTGVRPETFAREAKKIIVDIDRAEIFKDRGLKVDLGIVADAKNFLRVLNRLATNFQMPNFSSWLEKVNEWKKKYPACLPEYWQQKDSVNAYVFMKVISEESAPGDIIITETGSTLTWTMQGFEVKEGQQLFSAFGHSPMGYSLPAAMGASFFFDNQKKNIICLNGDGGIQMNIHELQTILDYGVPLKIFIMNNKSYGMIKQFQNVWMESRYEATTPETGCGFPDFIKIATAYGLKTETIRNHQELREKIKKVLNSEEAVVCNVLLKPDEKMIAKTDYGRPIEDSSPLLDREEFLNNMIVKPLDK